MKSFKILALLCLVGLSLVSCDKDKKSEWNNWYGYTKDDIVGTYSFSNVADAFNNVDGVGRHACPDADICILDKGGNTVEFRINCPDENFYRSFMGRPSPNENDFMLKMSSGYINAGNNRLKAYNVNAYVMENSTQQLRLHGFAALNTYKLVYPVPDYPVPDTIADDGEYYYFDVIKN